MKNKSALQTVLIYLFAIFAFAVYNSPARADPTSTIWTDTNGDWFSDANWNNGKPTSSTDAFINNGGKPNINSSGAMARSLTLGLNAADSGAVDVYGPNASLVVADSNNLPGSIYVGYRDRGTLTINGGGMVTSGNGNIAALAGMLLVSNGAVTVTGANSTWTIYGRLWIGGGSGGSGGTGLLSVTNGGNVVVQPPSNTGNIFVWPSGTLTGNGTVTADGALFQTSIQGTLAPTGTLLLQSNLTLTSTATTVCNVTPSAADNVNIVGYASLGGRLSVTMTGDFSSASTRFLLLHAYSGLNETRFNSQSIKYPTGQGWNPQITYDYDGGNVYLDRVYDLDP